MSNISEIRHVKFSFMKKSKNINNTDKTSRNEQFSRATERYEILNSKIQQIINNPKINPELKAKLNNQLSITQQLQQKVRENLGISRQTPDTEFINPLDSSSDHQVFENSNASISKNEVSQGKFDSTSSPFEYESKQKIVHENTQESATIELISNQLLQLQSKIEIIKEQNDQLKLQLNEEHEKLLKAQKENETLVKLNENFRYLNEDLQNQLHEYSDRLNRSDPSFDANTSSLEMIKSLESQVSSLEKENLELKKQIETEREQNKQFEESSNELQSIFEQVKRKAEIIAKQNVQLKKQLQETSKSFNEISSNNTEINSKIKSLEDTNTKLAEENNELKTKLVVETSKAEKKKLELIENLLATSKSYIDSDDISNSEDASQDGSF